MRVMVSWWTRKLLLSLLNMWKRRLFDFRFEERLRQAPECGSCRFEPWLNKAHEVSMLKHRFRINVVLLRNYFCRSFRWVRMWHFKACSWVWMQGMLSILSESKIMTFVIRRWSFLKTRWRIMFLEGAQGEYLFERSVILRCIKDFLHENWCFLCC